MSDIGDEAGNRAERFDELSKNPHPAASRAATAAQHPAWGLATMALLVVGLVAGYFSLVPHGTALSGCGATEGRLACAPATHPLVVVLPVAGLVFGLAISLIGGRLVAKRGRSPVPAAVVGWVVFAVAVGVSVAVAAIR